MAWLLYILWHVQRVNMNSYTRNYYFGYHSTDDRLKGNDTGTLGLLGTGSSHSGILLGSIIFNIQLIFSSFFWSPFLVLRQTQYQHNFNDQKHVYSTLVTLWIANIHNFSFSRDILQELDNVVFTCNIKLTI